MVCIAMSATSSAVSGSLIRSRMSSAACCSSGERKWGTIRSSIGKTSRRWTRQARPRYLLTALAGRSGVPTAIKASLRSTGKYGGSATLLSLPGDSRSEVAIQRAIEELGRKSFSRLSSARPSASRYQRSCPSQLAASFRRASPTLSVGRLRNARISSRRTPASGSSARASKMSRCFERGRRLLGLGILVFDVAVLTAVAAENAYGLLANARRPLG